MLTRKREWTPPILDGGWLIISSDELSPLGEVRGQRWYVHSKFGELVESARRLTDADALSGLLVQEGTGADRSYRQFTANAPGAYAAIQAGPARPPRAIGAPALVDQLAGQHMLGPKADFHGSNIRGPIRGPKAIIEHLTSRGDGCTFLPVGSGDAFAIVSNGKPHPGAADAARAAALLVGPFVHGRTPLCALCGEPAQTIAEIDLPWCGACAPKAGKGGKS